MWNEFITCQVIGAIKLVAQIHGIPVIMQPANKKGMGCMYLGIKEPPHSNPLNHQIIAMAHGVYYLQSNGIRKPQQGV